jgi:hypothetical protein
MSKNEAHRSAGATVDPNRKWWLLGIGSALTVGLAVLTRPRSDGPMPERRPGLFEPRIEYRLHVANKQTHRVDADPAGLARANGVDLDLYALASAMQSEEGTDRGRLAVGRAIWNAVGGKRSRLVAKLIPHGYFAAQDIGQYAATSKPPTARTLDLAAAIIEGRVPDMTFGAVQWDAPKLQDHNYQLYLRDPVKYFRYRFDSKAIAKRRIDAGMKEINLPGIPETRFWARA